MKSLQQLLREGLEQARELHEVAVKSGAESGDFTDFCARHLVQVLTPVMTAIQEHIESCPVTFESYEIPNEQGAGLPGESQPIPSETRYHDPFVREETPSVHVQAKLSVDGKELPRLMPPPFFVEGGWERGR